MSLPRFVIITALAALLALPASASAENKHSDSMSFVKNIPYDIKKEYGQSLPYGTDVEFGEIDGRRYAFAGSELNGLQIIDITSPRQARLVTAYDCAVSQGDTQVFERGGRTFVTYTNDYEDGKPIAKSDCYQEADAKGFRAISKNGSARLGTFIIEVTNPASPRTVSWVSFRHGSHNMTVHPSGRFLYNSNSDLITSVASRTPAIEVVDITRVTRPDRVTTLELSPLPGLGTESHDITFNEDGTRAYSAALSHGVIIDTTDPARPKVISEYDDESINVWHQSDPVTIGGRDFVIVEDELGGAAAPGVCPTGGVHVFDVSDETMPVKVGYWNIDDIAVRDPLDTCTAHVFDIHEDQQIMTIAYYMGGVRVVDLSGLADAPIGVGQGEVALGGAMREIGHYVMSDANAWSAKTPVIEPDGDFFLYADDINRGFDIFRFDAQKAPTAADAGGEFVSAAATQQKAGGVSLASLTSAAQGKQSRSGEQQAPQVLCLLKAMRRQ